MQVTATEFRKNLFALVERALAGDQIEVAYKGRVIRLAPVRPISKLSRLRDLNVMVGSPEDLDAALAKVSREALARWESEHQ